MLRRGVTLSVCVSVSVSECVCVSVSVCVCVCGWVGVSAARPAPRRPAPRSHAPAQPAGGVSQVYSWRSLCWVRGALTLVRVRQAGSDTCGAECRTG